MNTTTAPIGDARLVRPLIRNAPCPWGEHHWIRYVHPEDEDFTILILCAACGRDPAEALGQMAIE